MRLARDLSPVAIVLSALLAVPPTAASAGGAPRVQARSGDDSAPEAVATAGTVVLYDQTDSPGPSSITSENFESALDMFDNQAADDFVVPAGQSWTIDRVEVLGAYFNGTGPAASANVFFYQDAGGLPGAEVASRLNLVPVTGLDTGDFVIDILPVTLQAGHHWVSVQSNRAEPPNGQWGWTERTVQSYSPSAWRNPSNGFGTGCVNFQARTTCGVGSEPDLTFKLVGDTFTCAGVPATMVGTAAGEVLVGTPGNDIIVGLGGDDQIQGLDGDDLICAGDGNDTALAGRGTDRVLGEAGRDVVKGDAGNDRVSGGPENDGVVGGGGNDRLRGDQGKDRLKGQAGNDRLSGGPSRDRCNGGPGKDRGTCEVEIGIP